MVDFTCIVTAALFFASNLMIIIFLAKEYRRIHFDQDAYKELDPEYIKLEWDFRNRHSGFFLSAGIINAAGWFFFCFPLIQLSWVLSQRGSKFIGLHVGIGVLAMFGAFTEWISRLMYIGAVGGSSILSQQFNLSNWLSNGTEDDIGWRALEVTHVVIHGIVTLVDAFEWLAIFFIMILVHVSLRKWRTIDAGTFGGCWNSMGLFIGLLAFLDFVAEVLRLDGFRLFGPIVFAYSTINRCILLPIWLIMLGFKLPYAAMKLSQAPSSGVAA